MTHGSYILHFRKKNNLGEGRAGGGGGMKGRKKQRLMDRILNMLELPLNEDPALRPSSLPYLGLFFCLPLKFLNRSSNVSLMN